MRVVVASLAVAAPLSLWGCGGGDTTAAPAPDDGYNPTTVEAAWDNHFGAFGEFDVPRIMKDYDATSMITVFNDACFPFPGTTGNTYESPRGMMRYTGTEEIKGFFERLFEQLGNNISNVNDIGPKSPATNGGAQIRERGENGDIANANVFLTWRTSNLEKPIKYATDTFSWRQLDGRYWIDAQTIVITEDGATGASGADCSNEARRDPPAADTEIMKAWTNHLDAFLARTTEEQEGNFSMMADYDEHSIVAVYDNRDQSYIIYDDETKIKGFFDTLFTTMRQAASDCATQGQSPGCTIANEGLRVGLLEIEEKYNSILLVWMSNSHLKATDTFIFTDKGKIARQNIVVETRTPPGLQSVAMVI